MNKEIAKITALKCFSAAREISSLLDIYRVHCDKEEYEDLVLQVANVNAVILNDFLDKYISSLPDLEEEISHKIGTYGTLF